MITYDCQLSSFKILKHGVFFQSPQDIGTKCFQRFSKSWHVWTLHKGNSCNSYGLLPYLCRLVMVCLQRTSYWDPLNIRAGHCLETMGRSKTCGHFMTSVCPKGNVGWTWLMPSFPDIFVPGAFWNSKRTMYSTGSGCILMQVTCWPFVAPNKTESGWLYWSLGESMLRSEISRFWHWSLICLMKASSCSSYPDIWIELHDFPSFSVHSFYFPRHHIMVQLLDCSTENNGKTMGKQNFSNINSPPYGEVWRISAGTFAIVSLWAQGKISRQMGRQFRAAGVQQNPCPPWDAVQFWAPYFPWFNGGCFHLPPRFGRGHDLTMNAVRIVMRLGFGGFCSHWNFKRNDRGLHDCF